VKHLGLPPTSCMYISNNMAYNEDMYTLLKRIWPKDGVCWEGHTVHGWMCSSSTIFRDIKLSSCLAVAPTCCSFYTEVSSNVWRPSVEKHWCRRLSLHWRGNKNWSWMLYRLFILWQQHGISSVNSDSVAYCFSKDILDITT